MLRKLLYFFILLLGFSSLVRPQVVDSVALFQKFDNWQLSDKQSLFTYEEELDEGAYELPPLKLLGWYERGLVAAQNKGYDTLVYYFTNDLCMTHLLLLENDSQAEYYANRLKDHAIAMNSLPFQIKAHRTLGQVYGVCENHLASINNYMKALELGGDDPHLINVVKKGVVYTNLASSFFTLGEYESAIRYDSLAKENLQGEYKLDSLNTVGFIYRNLRDSYMALGQSHKADSTIKLLEGVLHSFEADTTPKYADEIADISYFHNFITLHYLEQDQIEQAIPHYKIYQEIGHHSERDKLLLEFHFYLRSGDLNKVRGILRQFSSFADTSQDRTYVNMQYLYHQKAENWQKAISYLKKFHALDFEDLAHNRIKFSAYTQEKLAAIENQIKLETLENEQAFQRRLSLFTYGLIALLLLAFASVFYAYRQGKSNLEKQKVIEQQAKQLGQVEQLKNRWITNLAHELQTPLNIIQGLSQQMLNASDLRENQEEQVHLILNSSSKLSQATKHILEISQQEKLPSDSRLVSFVLSDFFDHLLPDYKMLAQQKGLRLSTASFGEENPVLYTDLGKVERILGNLLSNAIRYSQEEGEIRLDYRASDLHHQLSVSDKGQGITPSDLPFIFDRYYQSTEEEPQGGFGLGLAICKELAESLGGTVRVKSELGTGSTFTLSIPQNKEKENETGPLFLFPERILPNVIQVEEDPTPSSLEGDYILIVEDNPDYRAYLKGILAKDFSLSFAQNGKEALKRLETHSHLPALILTDWMMPGMDGLQLIQHLGEMESLQNLPSIMLTARSLPTDTIKALRMGISDYIVKPVSPEALKARINHLLRISEEKQEVEIGQELDVTLIHSKENQDWLMDLDQVLAPMLGDFDLSTVHVAERMHLNNNTLNRKIKALTGLTAKKYIQELRYWEARKMLETQKYSSVKAVSLSVGFKDIKHFSRKFKERFGEYPSEYLG